MCLFHCLTYKLFPSPSPTPKFVHFNWKQISGIITESRVHIQSSISVLSKKKKKSRVNRERRSAGWCSSQKKWILKQSSSVVNWISGKTGNPGFLSLNAGESQGGREHQKKEPESPRAPTTQHFWLAAFKKAFQVGPSWYISKNASDTPYKAGSCTSKHVSCASP